METLLQNIAVRQREEIAKLYKHDFISRLKTDSLIEGLGSSLIKVIIGPRRAGKSTIALQALKDKKFAYLNFEDESIPEIDDGDKIIKALDQVYGPVDFYFFDEIQNLNRWEQFLNRQHRLGKNIVATGSNAKLLSEELSSSLTGRHIEIEILPLSFKEASEVQESPPAYFDKFLIEGGYPEVAYNKARYDSYLQTLWDSVLLKDIARRKKVRNIGALTNVLSLVLSNMTSRYSVESLVRALQKEISAPSVKKFLSYGVEAYLISELNQYSVKPKVRVKSDRKSYCIDNGFYSAKSVNFSDNYGALLENAVFNELRVRGYKTNFNLFYYQSRSGHEVDFLLRSGHINQELIQVCYSMSSLKTNERELRALVEAGEELNVDKLTIVTKNEERQEVAKGKKISVVPAYKWFMGEML